MRVSAISTPTYHVVKGKELKRQAVKTPIMEGQEEINGVSFKGYKRGKAAFGILGTLSGLCLGGIPGIIMAAASLGIGHAVDKAGDSAEEELKPYKDIESSDDTESVTDHLTHYD